VAFRPQANYTDRATAACQRSLCQSNCKKKRLCLKICRALQHKVLTATAATCSRWFLARRFFYLEDGGDTFLRSVISFHRIYTAPHPRRRYSLNDNVFINMGLDDHMKLFNVLFSVHHEIL
jgi:hypothetical protein